MRRAGAVAAVLLALLLATGCSAAGAYAPPPSQTPSVAAPTLPPGGIYLTDLGFTQAPPTFSVPRAAKLVSGYNIPDLINAIYGGADGPLVHDYLLANLAGMGFTVTASSADSILWDNDEWDGAFTMTAEQAGLTLRHIG